MQQEEGAEADDAPERDASIRWPFVTTLLFVSVVRFWFSFDRHVFHVSPDEPSQLAIARFLAGGRRWNMFDHATWQPLLGTLISPIYWFTSDGQTVVRWALGVNAVIGGLGAAVLLLLARRLTGLSPWVSAVLAAIVAVAPASLSASSFVWAEPLVALTFVGAVLVIIRFFDHDRLATAAGAIAISVAGYTAHSRLLPLIGTTLLLTVGVELWRRRWRRAAGLWIAAMAFIAASALWKRWLLARIWDDPSNQNTVDAVLKRAQHPLDVAESLIGQLWYQLAATIGVAALGMVVLIGWSLPRRPLDDPEPEPEPDADADADPDPTSSVLVRIRTALSVRNQTGTRAVDARIVLVSTLPLIGLSAVFMSGRSRPDQYIYGRYNDAVVWPVIVVGLAWVVDRARHGFERRHIVTIAAVAGTTVGLGALIDHLHGDEIRESYGVRAMIAGLLAHVDGNDTLDVWRTTWVTTALFLIGAAVLLVSRRIGRASAPVLAIAAAAAIATFAIGAVRTRDIVDAKLNGWDRAAAVRDVDALVPQGLPLGVRPVPSSQDPVIGWVPQRQRFLLYQLYLPERSFVRDRGTDDDVGPYVFAPLEDQQMLDADARLIWTDPAAKIGLWEEPSG